MPTNWNRLSLSSTPGMFATNQTSSVEEPNYEQERNDRTNEQQLGAPASSYSLHPVSTANESNNTTAIQTIDETISRG